MLSEEARHKASPVVGFNLCEITRMGKSVGEGSLGMTVNGHEGFFCGGENVLELDRGGGRKMLCVC